MEDDIHVQTFIGMRMSQHWDDLRTWEAFFKKYPIKTMIELGTDNGGMSLYFALQGYQRQIFFHTFDHQKWVDFDHGLCRILRLGDVFHHVDLFSDEGIRQVAELVETMPHPLAIFFDNGNKPLEWKLFAPLTSPGDFCIVHDWGSEFSDKDIGTVKVEKIMQEYYRGPKRNQWRSMFFQRV